MLFTMNDLSDKMTEAARADSVPARDLQCFVGPLKADSLIPLLWKSETSTMPTTERRAYRRLDLRWPLRLSGRTLGSVETWTENLSASGFYCVLEDPPAIGEKIECDLNIPNSGYQRTVGAISCQAEVIRIDVRNTPGFGVACKIVDFKYMRKRETTVLNN